MDPFQLFVETGVLVVGSEIALHATLVLNLENLVCIEIGVFGRFCEDVEAARRRCINFPVTPLHCRVTATSMRAGAAPTLLDGMKGNEHTVVRLAPNIFRLHTEVSRGVCQNEPFHKNEMTFVEQAV
ncbi:hypothetical protein DFH07DRAFT_774296 [Mycena maculata]|uniref:Uncharacterized protein n=1 Tax=Mycena maculata TaxID=230809 RepID=A0AAD7NAN4_9AGAR|nr:hypothetical protein DFH07DRAFT_774296 [Mycena maculata]